MQEIKIDTIDRAILRELQSDGRISNAELAERVNLSQSACLRRMRALEESGVIERYTAIVNQVASGLPQSVFVQITLKSQESHDLEAFEAEIHGHPQVMECYLMSGDADYLIRAIVADAADYERLHRRFFDQTALGGPGQIEFCLAHRS